LIEGFIVDIEVVVRVKRQEVGSLYRPGMLSFCVSLERDFELGRECPSVVMRVSLFAMVFHKLVYCTGGNDD
jgi:hypothetical protein